MAWVLLKTDWEYVTTDHVQRVLTLFLVGAHTDGVPEDTLCALLDWLIGEADGLSEPPIISGLWLGRLKDHDYPSIPSAMAIIEAWVQAPDLNAGSTRAAGRLHAVMTTLIKRPSPQ
ncbi:MAG: hypothetical protein ACJARS_004861 [bacterium]